MTTDQQNDSGHVPRDVGDVKIESSQGLYART